MLIKYVGKVSFNDIVDAPDLLLQGQIFRSSSILQLYYMEALPRNVILARVYTLIRDNKPSAVSEIVLDIDLDCQGQT